MDCGWDYGHNKACDGGDYQPAIHYLKNAGGAALEQDYPYVGLDSFCRCAACGGSAAAGTAPKGRPRPRCRPRPQDQPRPQGPINPQCTPGSGRHRPLPLPHPRPPSAAWPPPQGRQHQPRRPLQGLPRRALPRRGGADGGAGAARPGGGGSGRLARLFQVLLRGRVQRQQVRCAGGKWVLWGGRGWRRRRCTRAGRVQSAGGLGGCVAAGGAGGCRHRCRLPVLMPPAPSLAAGAPPGQTSWTMRCCWWVVVGPAGVLPVSLALLVVVLLVLLVLLVGHRKNCRCTQHPSFAPGPNTRTCPWPLYTAPPTAHTPPAGGLWHHAGRHRLLAHPQQLEQAVGRGLVPPLPHVLRRAPGAAAPCALRCRCALRRHALSRNTRTRWQLASQPSLLLAAPCLARRLTT
jgi:hypothetical protein